MRRQVRTPAQDTAARFVARSIEAQRRENRSALPGIRSLAGQAGVSYVSMWHAVRTFVDRGILVVRQGRGIEIAGMRSDPRDAARIPRSAPRPARPRWRTVARRIERDIATAETTVDGLLPSMKLMCNHYGVCHRTLMKAVDHLLERGVLHWDRRRLRVSMRHSTPPRNVVELMARDFDELRGPFAGHRNREFLSLLERLCAGHTCVLHARYYSLRDRALRQSSPPGNDPANDRKRVLGTCILGEGIATRHLQRLVHMAASTGEPVAVLDTAGYERPPRSGHSFTVQLFRCACTPRAGYDVGKHMGLLGHRHIAFITPSAESRWSRNRADGLREGLRLVQPEGSVHVKACPIRGTLTPGVARPRPVLDRDIDRLVATGIARSNPRAGFLRRSLESLRGEIRTEMHRQLLFDNLCAALDTVLEEGQTCWVCANDDVALQCLTYLREAGVSVPEHISIVGFDNTPEASMAVLTSYDFNYPALAHAMLDHILAPTGVRARRRSPVEVEGTLVVRATTTRVATDH